MCSHYQAAKTRQMLERMGVQLPGGWQPSASKDHVWPGYAAPFIRRPQAAGVDENPSTPHEVLDGVFGLLPFWAKDETLARRTYNARTETVASKPTFRDAWKRGQHCIIPVEAFYEPDWRSGKAVPTRISRIDGTPMGIAGLWERWKRANGAIVHSMTMLTVNADGHEVMQKFHKPQDEKRMIVVLPESQYDEWLAAPVESAMGFMTLYPADALTAVSEPRGSASSST